MARYEVRKDGTAARWDWLSLLTARLPYSVYEHDGPILGWHYIGCDATMRAARRRIRRKQAMNGEEIVYRESNGSAELPDLREWTLSHG